MQNPTTLTMQSDVPVESYRVQLVMGDAEALIKETVVDGPFAANEVVSRNIFSAGLVSTPPPFGAVLHFNVFAHTPAADSIRSQSEAFTFAVPAAPILTLS